MQRIIIETANSQHVEHLIAILKQMEFVQKVWVEEQEKELIDGLKEAINEVKLAKEGRISLPSAKSIIDDL